MMRQMLPFAARIGEAEVDVFDVVLLDHFDDFFGVRHSAHSLAWSTLTRLATLGTLSRNAGEGGPSPQGWVGEGRLLNVVIEEEFVGVRAQPHLVDLAGA